MYELAVCREFELAGHSRSNVRLRVKVFYKDVQVGICKIDLLVGGKVIVELKACDQLGDVHRAQVITYLTITGLTVGLLINFNVPRLVDGIKRVVHTASSH